MKRILVAVDFSKTTEAVVEQASSLAKSLKAKAWIIHVTPDQLESAAFAISPYYNFTPDLVTVPVGDIDMSRELCADEYRREHQALLRISAKLRQHGIESQAVLMKGDPSERILEKAEDLDVNIIVMGSHGHGLLRKMVLGSVSEKVLQKALCNVLIVPAPLDTGADR